MKKYFLFLVLLLLIISSCAIQNEKISEKENIYIPESFIGVVEIHFNEKDGEEMKCENNQRLYIVPTNGILKTKYKINEGTTYLGDKKFYYISPTHKIELKEIYNFTLPPKGVVVFKDYPIISKENTHLDIIAERYIVDSFCNFYKYIDTSKYNNR